MSQPIDRKSDNPGRFTLTDSQVEKIRRLYFEEGLGIYQIATRFGFGAGVIRKRLGIDEKKVAK